MASLRQPRPPFSSPCRLRTTASLPLHQSVLLPFPSAIRPSSRRAQGRGFGTSLPEGKKQKAEKSSSCEINKTVEKGEDDEIPEEVFDRMTKRILLYIGAPVASGLGLLCVLSLLKERGIWEVPEWLPFFIISVSFRSLGLGVAYGILSTSWDLDDEGSVLGWKEVKKNWPEIWKEEIRR